MKVDFGFFKDAEVDGNVMSLDERIKETFKNSDADEIVELFRGGELLMICRNEKELRSALCNQGLNCKVEP